MTDRAMELAVALLADPWVDKRIGKVCRDLAKKWEAENLERNTRDDTKQRLSTALEQLGTVRERLLSAKQAVRGCLPQMGYSTLTDAELEWELEQGNQQVPAIQRARAVLANLDIKTAQTLKPDAPERPRCETCQHWDNSAIVGGSEKTGMCRGALPELDRSTGAAVWPFSQATDSCPHHNPSDF